MLLIKHVSSSWIAHVKPLLICVYFIVNSAGAILSSSCLLAQPEFSVPEQLTPYVDDQAMIKNGHTVIALLNTAAFKPNIWSFESDGKTHTVNRALKGECDAPEYHAFYRGMHLAHIPIIFFCRSKK
jgi:hypothetical protein